MTKTSIVLLIAAATIASCGDGKRHHAHAHDPRPERTNRIHLDGRIRRNLGITWATARTGALEVVRSIPGEIVAPPERSWTVRTPLAGTMMRAVARWQRVARGDVVAEIAAPGLSAWQQRLHEARTRAEEARLAVARERAALAPARALARTTREVAASAREALAPAETALAESRRVAQAAQRRLEELRRLRAKDAVAEGVLLAAEREALAASSETRAAARALREARVEAAEQTLAAAEAQTRARQAGDRIALLEERAAAAASSFTGDLTALAAALGTRVAELEATDDDGRPRWAAMDRLVLRAPADGTVTSAPAAPPAWIGRDAEIAVLIDAAQVLFTARIPETEAAGLPAEPVVRVRAAGAGDAALAEAATLRPIAEAQTRSVVLEVRLSNPRGTLRPGISATALVALGGERPPRILVPSRCVVRDGLDRVVFVRADDDRDDVIRTEVTVGDSSAGWTEVLGGVDVGAELVADGARQLRYARARQVSGGGHVHSDGTWHEGH